MSEWLPLAVYVLCAATSVACAVLLLRGFARSGTRFLLWCALCFVALGVNNVLLLIDRGLYENTNLFVAGVDLAVWRSAIALGGLGILIYGLVWDTE